MLRKIRIALAAFFFVGITLLFVGIGHDWWGWMAKLQFLPSALALNLVVVGPFSFSDASTAPPSARWASSRTSSSGSAAPSANGSATAASASSSR